MKKINSISFFLLLALFLLGFTTNSCQEESYAQGKKLYEFHCQNCHMEDGTGLKGDIPPLANSDYLAENQNLLACIIVNGQTDVITVNGQTYTTPMPAVTGLSEFQIANIINYINHAWGNDCGFQTMEDLKKQLSDCE